MKRELPVFQALEDEFDGFLELQKSDKPPQCSPAAYQFPAFIDILCQSSIGAQTSAYSESTQTNCTP